MEQSTESSKTPIMYRPRPLYRRMMNEIAATTGIPRATIVGNVMKQWLDGLPVGENGKLIVKIVSQTGK